ncbi:hypothetical protein COLO4_24194 [Corchorus olitorius]|uniref:Uncharacterized protein n=1 Tax=Corchorus olitorius TaxID=93759 RepID=A0A1R3ICD5_9ROSI|nr:hypothetical protein COLO4_24194 [Corchorus olitorius]
MQSKQCNEKVGSEKVTPNAPQNINGKSKKCITPIYIFQTHVFKDNVKARTSWAHSSQRQAMHEMKQSDRCRNNTQLEDHAV